MVRVAGTRAEQRGRRAATFFGEPRTIVKTIAGELKLRVQVLAGLVGLMWLEEIADLVIFHGALDADGIRPRTEAGLWGIVLAPFLHAGFAHLLANTVPLLVLGWL